MDTYKDFAERYDLFFGKLGEYSPVRTEFFRKLFADNQVSSVLDCACGTGNDLIFFNKLGCEVTGSDLSESMLNRAQKNLTEYGIKIPLVKADYRDLPRHFEKQFDAVTCLSTAIAEMPDEAELLKAFTSMYKMLRPGGILVLTQGTTDKQWREKPRFVPMINTRDFSRICVIDYLEKGARYNILDIFHNEKSTDFKVWGIDYPMITLKVDQEGLLTASGFRSIDFYGNFHFQPYNTESSDYLITVAHK